MRKLLLIQAMAILAVSVIAGWVGGYVEARSALLGGAAYFLPNLLFALRLRVGIAARRVSAVGFLIGAAVKLCAVVALLLILPQLVVVSWPALVAGLFVVLLANTFALRLKT